MKKYSISEIAKIMNVAPSTIRFYDNEGLLPSVEKVNGRRVFTEKDFGWLKLLNSMKSTGMSIKDIRLYVDLVQKGDSTLKERHEIILKQKENIYYQIEELNTSLKILDYKDWYYQTAIEAGTEMIHWNKCCKASLEPDEIPEDK